MRIAFRTVWMPIRHGGTACERKAYDTLGVETGGGSICLPKTQGTRLRIQAAVHGRSMDDEARDILRCVLNQQPQGPRNLGTAIHDLFRPFGGLDMAEVPRDKMREPPRVDG
jgi:plasmid stability protein